jgi:arylsulfatase A-like enzyme
MKAFASPGIEICRRWLAATLGFALALSLAACGGGGGEASAQAREQPNGEASAQATKQPNIVLIVADDMGYSDIGAFGSEIATPNIDALANAGRVLTNFYTAPSCSPTRGMLISGADSHRVGLAQLENQTTALINAKNAPFGVDFGFGNVPDGYGGHLLDSALSMPQLLRDGGYHTYMAGKWHLAYEFVATPTGGGSVFKPSAFPNKKGFERSFALLNGAGAHFAPVPGAPPTIYDNTTYTDDDVPFPAAKLPADFYSTKAYTDKLISYIESNRSDGKPFFAYAAYTAPHWPLQAPDADIAAQAGRYDEGYDVIRDRRIARMKQLGILPPGFVQNPGLASVAGGGTGKKRWSELSATEKALQARGMEVYAAMVSNMDAHIGRLVQYLKDTGQYDNTLIVFMSDNGSDSSPPAGAAITASTPLASMGRPGSTIAYGERWAEVSAAPFRLWKAFTGAEGSVSVPAIVKMPGASKARRPLTATTLVKDLLPTFLDIAGIPVPADSYNGQPIVPISGVSLRNALQSNADSPTVRPPGQTIALEYFGQGYVLRNDGWKLSLSATPGVTPASNADVPWRLFNIATDRGETQDLAAAFPDIVNALKVEWDKYVVDNGVLITAKPPAERRNPSSL